MAYSKLASWEITANRPMIEPDEFLLHRAFESFKMMIIIGIVLLFIPPFIWGIVVLLFIHYITRNSGVMLTDKRIVAFTKRFRPGEYRVWQVPIRHVIQARVMPRDSLLDVFFRVGNISIQYEGEKGTATWVLPNIKNPKALVCAIAQRRERLISEPTQTTSAHP